MGKQKISYAEAQKKPQAYSIPESDTQVVKSQQFMEELAGKGIKTKLFLTFYEFEREDSKAKEWRYEYPIVELVNKADLPIEISCNNLGVHVYSTQEFEYVDLHEAVRFDVPEPTKMRKLEAVTAKKVGAWIEYVSAELEAKQRLSVERKEEIAAFLNSVKQTGLKFDLWADGLQGAVERCGLRYEYHINVKNGSIFQDISVLHSVRGLDNFLLLSENKFKG